jgi:hypothetical protein
MANGAGAEADDKEIIVAFLQAEESIILKEIISEDEPAV